MGSTDGATIWIEASGGGVAADASGKIFRPLFTTKPQGSGIGLSLARRAVVSQGGQLLLTPAEPGRGARFAIVL